MLRKILPLVVGVLAASLLLVGCDNKKKEITLTIKTPTLAMNSVLHPEVKESHDFLEAAKRAFEKKHAAENVKIKLVKFRYTDEDRFIMGCFDKPEATDVLFEGYFNMAGYIHTGRVVPLDDIISPRLERSVNANIWKMSRVDGRTYMMPFYGIQNVRTFKKVMFRRAGLEKYIRPELCIQNWSIEENEHVFEKLKALPGVYPHFMYAANEQGDTHIMTLLRSHGCSFFDSHNRVKVNTPEGIAALSWLKRCKDKGYFPPQCENLEIVNNNKLFSQNKLGLHLLNNASKEVLDTENYGMANFPAPNGKGLTTTFRVGFEVFDNGNAEKVKWGKEFVRFIMESPELMDYSVGMVPASSEVVERHAKDFAYLKVFAQNDDNTWNFTANNPNWRGVRKVFYKVINALLDGTLTPEQAAVKIDKDCNEAIEKGVKNSKLHK